MDKKLNRQIGFVRGEAVDSKKTSVVEKKEVEVKKETDPVLNLSSVLELADKKSKKIVDWINGHEEFKWGVMCTKLEIDRGNFQRILKNPTLKIKFELIPKIELFLKKYGYAE